MFLAGVIDELETDRFLRDYRRSYCNFDYCMDSFADRRSCAVDAGWTVRRGSFMGWFVVLERGHNIVPLTWRETFRLTGAFDRAMSRLRRDRKTYLRSLH